MTIPVQTGNLTLFSAPKHVAQRCAQDRLYHAAEGLFARLYERRALGKFKKQREAPEPAYCDDHRHPSKEQSYTRIGQLSIAFLSLVLARISVSASL